MSRIIKVILFTLIFVLGYTSIGNTALASTSGEKSFIVTAYYSPLPNQKHYTTGSYYGDIKLNGAGHTTASGNSVFSGLLAGPKNYPYGTKIYFEGYGVGVIEDRGGAIVKAGVKGHEYDRIDIWMGYGDEGLMRAKKWGKKTIVGQVVDSSNEVTLKFGENILNGYENLKVNPENTDKNQVISLQKFFTKLGLYKGSIDGKYNSIKQALVDFQIKNKIISSKYDEAAGYYGPKTIVKILKKYGNEPLIKEKVHHNLAQISEKIKIILDYGEITLNADSPEKNDVENVQKLFKKLELYNGKIDGNYNSIKNDIISFQKKVGLITHDNSWGAGHIGDKTKSQLILYFEEQDRIEAIRERAANSGLEEHEIIKLNTISKKLTSYIKRKSRGSKSKETILKKNFVKRLTVLVNKTSSKKLKNKLIFLKENLS